MTAMDAYAVALADAVRMDADGGSVEERATAQRRLVFFDPMRRHGGSRPERQTWTPGLANATPTTGRG